MLRTYFGLARDPFTHDDDAPLMEHQQRHFDILKVHNRQGGLCLILGEPGTGKTILKNAITRHDPKQWITPVINRSLHTWPNLLRLLCHAMQLETTGNDHSRSAAETDCPEGSPARGERSESNAKPASSSKPAPSTAKANSSFPSSTTPTSSPTQPFTASVCC